LPELPNIVTRRLAERELRPDAPHPDVDLLTAFAEKALPERDRGAVMNHLADCSRCREMVALAQPTEALADSVVVPRRSPSGLFFLRWGALAVCAVLAVSFAVLYKHQPVEKQLEAKNQVSAPMLEQKSEPLPSAKVEFGDKGKDAAKKVEGNPAVPEIPSAGPLRKRESDALAAPPGRYDTNYSLGIDAKSKRSLVPLSRAPSPLDDRVANDRAGNDRAGFVANGALVGGNIATKKSELPLQGRDFSQLMQLKPGAAGTTGVTGGGSEAAVAPSVAEAVPNEVMADQDKANKRDEGGYVLSKSVTPSAGSAKVRKEVNSEVRSKASAGLVGAAVAAPPPAPVAGEVRGVVVDPSGAAVSGAKVTIMNTATGASLASSTNETGNYDVPSVPPGPYTIAISKPGFQEFMRPGITVTPSMVAMNATLQVGAVAETVTVEAQAASLDTASAATSSTAAYGADDRRALRASSAEIATLPNLVPARPAGTWQISADGNLERSFDGGKSWESVPFAQSMANQSMTSQSMIRPSVTNQPVAGQQTRLRVVAASGFQVWVGGNGGVLLHSKDAGGHFTSVKVHRKQASVTGDIVALTFPDAQHGRLETADHEVWITSDGGKTWRPAAKAK
jgi:hypothetical protein